MNKEGETRKYLTNVLSKEGGKGRGAEFGKSLRCLLAAPQSRSRGLKAKLNHLGEFRTTSSIWKGGSEGEERRRWKELGLNLQ